MATCFTTHPANAVVLGPLGRWQPYQGANLLKAASLPAPWHPVPVSIARSLWCLLPYTGARWSLLLNDHMDVQVIICNEGGPRYGPGNFTTVVQQARSAARRAALSSCPVPPAHTRVLALYGLNSETTDFLNWEREFYDLVHHSWNRLFKVSMAVCTAGKTEPETPTLACVFM